MPVEGLSACDVEEVFIGRNEDFRCLNQNWSSHRLFGIYGIRAVGKSRFVNEFIRRKANEKVSSNLNINIPLDESDEDNEIYYDRNAYNVSHIRVVYRDLRVLARQSLDISSLYADICASLGVPTRPQATRTSEWILHIAEELSNIEHQYSSIVLFFDNVEDITEGPLHDDFMRLVVHIIKYCSFVKTIVTSTTQIKLAQLRRVYYTQELRPLSTDVARLLLRSVTGSTDLGPHEDEIVHRSEGLPLLILMVGSELAGNVEGEGLTAEEMVDLLRDHRMRTLNKEMYPGDEPVGEVYWKFINRLKPRLLHQLTELEYIPGSFTASQAMNILDFETTALVKNEVLVPIRRRYILTYDPTSRRFDIQGILREVLDMYQELPNLPEVRKRYCVTFTALMLRLSQVLVKEEYAEALAELAHEQPNLRKLMLDVQYTREDTYPFFIHIAEKCTSLIEQYLSAECERFYDGCIKFAHMYGREEDKAIVYVAVGSMYTNIKNELPKGAENYEKALAILQHGGRTLSLATIYQRMGWNLHKQGRNSDAIGFFQKSLDISQRGGPEFYPINLQSLNSLGITNTCLGRFDEAERYHFGSLERRKKINGKRSPLVGATLNNIGVFYDQKEEYDKALEYFLAGYELKKGPNMPIVTQIYSLNNIAAAYARNNQPERSHELIEEAFTLLRQNENESLDALAMTYDLLGKVLRRETKLEDADEKFSRAVEIREKIVPDGVVYFESQVHLAQIKLQRGMLPSALKVAHKALALSSRSIDSMPQNSYIYECLQCIAEVYKQTQQVDKYRETLEKIESELMRLAQVCQQQINERRLVRINEWLVDVKAKLDNLTSQPASGSSNTDK